jgi:hypothetical protein
MSSTGLNSNIYQSTRLYLDLLNNFLIEANYAKETGKAYSNQDVLEFFKGLADKSSIDPEKQLLRSFFNRFYKLKSKNTENQLAYIARNLQSNSFDAKVLSEIESLVDVLKFQCAQSYARMKGGR